MKNKNKIQLKSPAVKERLDVMAAVVECNGVSVDEFFDELDERIKLRFNA